MGHHPVYSGGPNGDTPALLSELAPLLVGNAAAAYFNGHDHDMQHIIVDGVSYFTVGSGAEDSSTPQSVSHTFGSFPFPHMLRTDNALVAAAAAAALLLLLLLRARPPSFDGTTLGAKIDVLGACSSYQWRFA